MPMSHARKEYEDFKRLAPDAYEIVLSLGKVAAKAGIDKQLLELIKLRASQINGCAFCVQFHILQGESFGISADKPIWWWYGARRRQFSARERAALGLDRSADVAECGRQRRGPMRRPVRNSPSQELTYLTSAIASINVWNRFGAAFRWTPPARQKDPAQPLTAHQPRLSSVV